MSITAVVPVPVLDPWYVYVNNLSWINTWGYVLIKTFAELIQDSIVQLF